MLSGQTFIVSRRQGLGICTQCYQKEAAEDALAAGSCDVLDPYVVTFEKQEDGQGSKRAIKTCGYFG